MIDVILPVLNEEEALPWVLSRLPAGYRGVVVDNGSTDCSARVAREFGATVVYESQRGFGAACSSGLRASRSDIVCFMDADASLDPIELPRVVGPVETNRAELVLGARQPQSGAWPFHARVANKLLSFEVSRRTGLRLTDLGPMRAARRLDLLELGIQDRRFGWPLEMVLRANRGHWRIAEVTVSYGARRGTSKVTGTIGGTARAIRDMAPLLR